MPYQLSLFTLDETLSDDPIRMLREGASLVLSSPAVKTRMPRVIIF